MRSLPVSLLLVLAPCAVSGQGPVPSPSPAAVRFALTAVAGGFRADGPDYRASFARTGATFTPALGRRAPRALPVRLCRSSVGRERGAVTTLAPAPAEVRDGAVCHAAAPGVVERWRPGAAGVELSYRFARRPAGAGDLVVRLRVESELESVAATADGGASLSDPRWGGIHIGAATGIDADGARVRGTVILSRGWLELRLPAAFVDGARYPVLLDPLIGTELRVGNGDDSGVDVAFEGGSGSYLLVFERAISVANVDVLGQRFDAQGNPVGALLPIRDTTDRVTAEPAVCAVRSSGRFAVAWREAPSVLGPWTVRALAVDPDGSLSSIVDVGSGGRGPMGPRIGGDASTAGSHAILTWAHGNGIQTASVLVPPAPAAPNLAGSDQVAIPVASYGLAITHSGGSARRWVVLVDAIEGLGSSIRARLVDHLGQIQDVLTLPPPPGISRGAVAIDGDGSLFVAAYDRGEIRCQRLRWNGSNLVAEGGETVVASDPAGVSDPAVAWLGPKYLVAWSQGGGTAAARSIRGIALQETTCVPCGLPFTIDLPGYDFAPAIGPQRAAGVAGDQAMLAFVSNDVAAPFASKVFVQRFDGQTDGAVTNLGGECGATYAESLSGPVSLGNDALDVRVSDVNSATAAFLGIAAAGVPPLPCGGCRIAIPALLVPAAIRRGVARAPFPIPCDAGLVGGRVEVQFLMLDATVNACPLVSGLAFSDRLDIEVGH